MENQDLESRLRAECPGGELTISTSEDKRTRRRRALRIVAPLHIAWQSYLTILSLCFLVQNPILSCFCQNDVGIVSSYTTFNHSVNFTHLVIDSETGRLYAGATNWIYQFNTSLGLESSASTGPEMDNVDCPPSDCTGYSLRPTTNVNKVLLIDQATRRLIACGSAHQGACRRHHLNNVHDHEALVSIPVAANDENSSTYAFIGPATYHPYRVLYVAATHSRIGSYRDMVPAISGRSLDPDDRLFGILEHSFSSIAAVNIANHIKDYYLVHYVYGFHTEDFVYFATVQRKSHHRALEEWGYITRLARLCTSDPSFNTYTEVTLQCRGSDGTDYNILTDAVLANVGSDLVRDYRLKNSKVLVGVFAQSKDHTATPGSRSAVCVFPLSRIQQKFTDNIHMCYNGSVLTRNMDYVAGSLETCPEPGKSGNVYSFCNETLKLNGTVPIQELATITYPNTTLTSVSVALTGQHTVAFVGTNAGLVKKILLTNRTRAEEFEEIPVDSGNPILADMELDASGHYLYAASPYKISKIQVARCEQYSTCSACLQARNPFCGWCSLEKRCTKKWACHNATEDRSSSRWLSLDTQQCIDFQSITPAQLPLTSVATVEISINQLPQLPRNAHYLCVFGAADPVRARLTVNGLACTTPPIKDRPRVAYGTDHTDVTLYIRSSETNTDFLHRPFTFYDCSVHKTCGACVTSSFACNWCFSENTCSHNVSTCSRNVITGENNPDASLIKGRQHCPTFSVDSNILLPDGVRTAVAVEVRNLPSPADNFQCLIEIEGNMGRVNATLRQNQIICDEALYTYKQDVGEKLGALTVLWNGDTFIGRTNMTVYKCALLGSHGGRADCSLCLTRDPRYQCSWCGNACSYAPSCVQPVSTTCPPPRIDWIHPLSGPIEGGTLVTIEGSNLGTTLKEIQDKINIGGIPCRPVEYNVSVRVVCVTGPSDSPRTADVVVGNRAGLTQSKEKFQYKIIHVVDSWPKMGPQSGGTRIYINGSNLNIGSNVEVKLDDLPCVVDKALASNGQISCKTTKSTLPYYNVSELVLRIDNATKVIYNPYVYVEDPIIQKISPLKSFVSGGRRVIIRGVNFNAIQQPRMAVFDGDRVVNETICEVLSQSDMVCSSPPINAATFHTSPIARRGSEDDSTDVWRFRIGFIMDDVQSVRDLPTNFPTLLSDLIYVPDPQVYSFEDGVKLYKGESLVIEGVSLRDASSENEVNVTIGMHTCNITSLASNQLVCLPPEVQPSGTDEIGRWTENDLPLVVVRIGSNIRHEVGYLRYEVSRKYDLPPEAIGAIAVVGFILMVLSLVILILLRHKSSQAEREYKRIQLQMDDLEKSVRIECKQAFAELQTDMTDLTNDLHTMGIPTLDHRSYVMKVFFPGVYDHPLLQDTKLKNNGYYNNYEVAMSQFHQLLLNKGFLITFINTLESQQGFTIRDRVNVASLLMIISMGKLDYGTDILRTLLLQLIERSSDTKHPQLMLRRTESVVEKMLTNWLALSMYDYLKEYAGSSLFLLFSAIKYQIEKGPVDAVTHDARYSLFEARLLREQIDYSVVTIHVVQECQDDKIICRVLDCDTISQVKGKILDVLYKNTPFSLRPCIHDVDLEWRHGRGGHVILQDEDLTSKSVNGWRHINTLRHYGVKDVAVMALVNKQNDSFSSNCTISMNSVSPIVNNQCDLEQGMKYWHLVKPEDDTKDIYSSKAIPEIFLTRLLSTKGTVQKYVDDFFSAILTVNEALPPSIKWLFDLLDEAAIAHGITDPEVPHAWKSNCLPLRFWVNFIKNPDFILDVQKTPIVDSCLSVIAQTLMDACSMSEHRLGKDSPSNKLLFARDIPRYRKKVNDFYHALAMQPRVTDQEMCAIMQRLSLAHNGELDPSGAVKELYVYAAKYRDHLLLALEAEPNCRRLHLAHKLHNVACTLDGEQTSVC